MKIIQSRVWLMFPLLLLLAGCGGAIESMTFTSPAGDRSIEVSGKRESPLGPIIVSVTLKVLAGSDTFTFEHQAGSLTKETVTATWVNDMACTLSFKLDDGTSWEVEAFLMDDKIKAIKKYKIDGKSLFE